MLGAIKERGWNMIDHVLRHGEELPCAIIGGTINGKRYRGRSEVPVAIPKFSGGYPKFTIFGYLTKCGILILLLFFIVERIRI